MRRTTVFGFVILAAASVSVSALAQSPDDSLKIYAVDVVKTTPFQKPFTGYGVYLGNGAVITAAHVIGRWGFLKNPHVLIAGLDLPAKIIKEGSLEQIDLTLLSVDETRLPVRLRMRRNPVCKQPAAPGEDVFVVATDHIVHSQIISPLLINPRYRTRFASLITEPAGSGSGVFDARKKCLVGIISRAIEKFDYQVAEDGKVVAEPTGQAGYFVPAAEITDFIPPEFRF
jgi:hypothetical protein